MPPRSSSPICERSLDLTLIGIGRRDIPQCSPKHFLMEVFCRTFSGGRRPSQENKKNVDPPKLDDDEKPKPEDERPKPEYANARDEVKAIHYAKTGAYPTVKLLDRIEGLLVTKGRTFDDYLAVLKPHLGHAWKNPGGFLTHMARTGFGALVSPPQEMPKPKCPTCMADNQRGAILQSGAIVPCPACSNPEWRAELTAKLNRPAKKTQGASGE